MLKEIEDILLEKVKVDIIPKRHIYRWKNTSNMEIKGALVELLLDSRYYTKIYPHLNFSDYYPFIFEYYLECIELNCDDILDDLDSWLDCGHLAGYSLVNFIVGIWNDSSLGEKEIEAFREDVKRRLENICIGADIELKEILINGLLEHLFEYNNIRDYFIDWKNKKKLEDYYRCAIDKSQRIIFRNF